VFHNRRCGADIRTLAAVISSGRLGRLWRVHSPFDLDDPATLDAGPDAVRTLAVLDAARLSAERGNSVEVPLAPGPERLGQAAGSSRG